MLPMWTMWSWSAESNGFLPWGTNLPLPHLQQVWTQFMIRWQTHTASSRGVTWQGSMHQWEGAVAPSSASGQSPPSYQRAGPADSCLAKAGSRTCVLTASPHSLPSLFHSLQTSCRGRTLSSESPLIYTPTWKPWNMSQASLILHSSPPDSYVRALTKSRGSQFHLFGLSRGQIVWRLRQLTCFMRENTPNPAFLSLIFKYLVISMF